MHALLSTVCDKVCWADLFSNVSQETITGLTYWGILEKIQLDMFLSRPVGWTFWDFWGWTLLVRVHLNLTKALFLHLFDSTNIFWSHHDCSLYRLYWNTKSPKIVSKWVLMITVAGAPDLGLSSSLHTPSFFLILSNDCALCRSLSKLKLGGSSPSRMARAIFEGLSVCRICEVCLIFIRSSHTQNQISFLKKVTSFVSSADKQSGVFTIALQSSQQS